MQKIGFTEAVEELVDKDPKYDREAYTMLRDSLELTVKKLKGGKVIGSRHVSAQQLLEGVREFALKEYGPMAATVLEFWGVRSSSDIGTLVFNLIEAGVFGKTDTDRPEDFDNGFDFHEAFVQPFLPATRSRENSPEVK